jgi:5-formyltetrahydrofolate cyclo-ligase
MVEKRSLKAFARSTFRGRLADLGPAERERDERNLALQLATFLETLEIRNLAAYRPHLQSPEIGWGGLLDSIHEQGVKVSFPRTEVDPTHGPKMVMIQERVLPSRRDWKRSFSGRVEEPASLGVEVAPDELDVILVPGLLFSSWGARLGRGLGSYDRFLPRATRAFKLGVCFEFQIMDPWPFEGEDYPVDVVVTPQRILILNPGNIPPQRRKQ